MIITRLVVELPAEHVLARRDARVYLQQHINGQRAFVDREAGIRKRETPDFPFRVIDPLNGESLARVKAQLGRNEIAEAGMVGVHVIAGQNLGDYLGARRASGANRWTPNFQAGRYDRLL